MHGARRPTPGMIGTLGHIVAIRCSRAGNHAACVTCKLMVMDGNLAFVGEVRARSHLFKLRASTSQLQIRNSYDETIIQITYTPPYRRRNPTRP